MLRRLLDCNEVKVDSLSCQKGCGISDFIDKTACNKRHFKDSNEYWWSFMAYFFY